MDTTLKSGAFLPWLALVFVSGCGIHYGRSPSDQLAPSLPRIASGQLTGASGQTVQGLISVYGNSGSSSYVLRAEGLSMPTDNTLQFRIYVQGGTYRVITPVYSGTRNYSFSASANAEFTSVTLYSDSANAAYGTATLLND